jgi:hypothetical protein
MNKKILNLFYFALTVVILIAVLKIANYFPMAIQKDTMRRYRSIEEVKSNLNIREILIPSYFPQNFVWPPSEIFAQKKPFTAVVMEFKHAQNRDVALIISQADSTSFEPDKKIRIIQVKEKVSYPLKDRNIVLEAGMCKNEEPCSRIAWDEGRHRITVTAKASPPELLKIAESMIK